MEKLQRFRRYSKRVVDRLTKSEEDEIAADWNLTTNIYKEDLSISWNINNVNNCFLKTGEFYESPTFCTGFSKEIKWALRLYPKGRNHSEKVAIFLHRDSENVRTEIKCLLQLKLIPELSVDDKMKVKNEIYSWKYPSKAVVENDENGELREWGTDELIPTRYLLRKKSFCIMSHLSVNYDEKAAHCCYAGPLISSTLNDDFKEMYKSGKFSDVTLRLGKKTFRAHKAVLAARSVVFAAMFDHDMKESKTNEIDIENIDPTVMTHVLLYIYTGKVEDLTLNKAANLFSVADRYSLTELREGCVATMLSNLSVENVCQIAVLADMHSESKLKLAANYFFRKYKYEILQTKEWKEIVRTKPQLASDILEAVSTEFNTSVSKSSH